MMKVKLGGKIMREFVALDRIYAHKKLDKKLEDKHCKGTKMCVAAKSFTLDNYKTYLVDGTSMYRQQMLFENKKTQGVQGK